MSDDIPQWAWDKVDAIDRSHQPNNQIEWARYADALRCALVEHIAEHEEPPVDPLLIEARKVVECSVHWSPQTDRDLQSGKNDNTPEVKIALAALKRGMELAREAKP